MSAYAKTPLRLGALLGADRPDYEAKYPPRDYSRAIASAARMGTFDAGRLYNDQQMEAMSRLYGSDIYDVADMTEAPWDALTLSQRKAWEEWAKRLGNHGDRFPSHVRVWKMRARAGDTLLSMSADAANGTPEVQP